MKRTQIAKISWHGFNVSCVYLYDTVNPYRIYIHSMTRNKYGYYTESRKQIAAYADMTSAMYHIYKLSYQKEYGS